MYIQAYNGLDWIYVPININIYYLLLFYGYINIWFYSQNYKYPDYLLRIKTNNESNQILQIFCVLEKYCLFIDPYNLKQKDNIITQ